MPTTMALIAGSAGFRPSFWVSPVFGQTCSRRCALDSTQSKGALGTFWLKWTIPVLFYQRRSAKESLEKARDRTRHFPTSPLDLSLPVARFGAQGRRGKSRRHTLIRWLISREQPSMVLKVALADDQLGLAARGRRARRDQTGPPGPRPQQNCSLG